MPRRPPASPRPVALSGRRLLTCLACLSAAAAACSSGGAGGGAGTGGSRPATGGALGAGGAVGVGSGGSAASGSGGAAVSGSGGASPEHTGGAGVASSGGASAGGHGGNGGNGGNGGTIGNGLGGRGNAGGTSATGGLGGGTPATGSGGAPAGPVLAFPGAQGYGKNATGARNDGTVYHVTNLDDAGPGSFRDAVSVSGRFVVFDVGGYIRLATAVPVKSNITIAGQTAPGEGIGFRGGELSFAKSSNIIMRHVRIRPGSETASDEDDALSLYRASNVMIDHASFEFAPWNNIDAVSDDWQNQPVTNVTIQDSLIADPTGQQFGAHMESVSSNMAWYRNIFANAHNRNPLAKINTVFVNNLLYNCSAGYTTHTSTAFKHDIVNNTFVFGPASTGTDNTWFQIDQNQSIFTAGNIKDTNRDGSLNGAATTPYWYQGEGTVLAAPWSPETMATRPLDTLSGARVALSQAGTLPRDAMDALIVGQVMTLGKGATGMGAGTVGPDAALYTSQAQTGLPNNGYGAIMGGTRPLDTDNDGMPDLWETATASNPAVNDAMNKAPDGYTNLERYVNWLAVPHATASAAPVEVDLAAFTSGFAAVSPRYTVANAVNGTVALQGDGRTARFTPTVGVKGVGSFVFTVTGSDGSTWTSPVLVLAAP